MTNRPNRGGDDMRAGRGQRWVCARTGNVATQFMHINELTGRGGGVFEQLR